MIDVSDIPKAELLAELYNRSRVQGMGVLAQVPGNMTVQQAETLLGGKESAYFDYVHGRILKVEINGRVLDPMLYDRDLGKGAAWEAVKAVRGRLKEQSDG